MIVGKVKGSIVSTRKCSELRGYKLLVVEEIGTKGITFIAADQLGAGVDEYVLITQGLAANYALSKQTPIDALVVGIVDDIKHLNLNKE